MSDKKSGNKPIIIAGIVCAVLVILLILTVAFADTAVANIKLSKLRREVSDCSEIVISDPMYKGEMSYGREVILTGEQTAALRDKLLAATEKTSFSERLSGSVGFWDTQMKLYVGEEEYSVYLKSDAIYIAELNGYLFNIDEDCKQAYDDFYNEVSKLIQHAEN